MYRSVLPVLDQVEFTPWLFNGDLLHYCKAHNIQLQSYSPVTRAKKFDDPGLIALCEKYGKTPAQIILRWNIEHGISTIPKSSSKARLLENFNIWDFSLSKADVQQMDGFNENFRICDDPMAML